ncbi:UMP-CMP kinase 2, mitochondrial isoform X2 [Phasianus colchicus]|uniref:UMP-CMP kinase 2, mitochondrial isoform X2 n=1 Tax=Phasianus colchicus TaxID=9054 RepID=UPI00129ED948|nr:UMP-CMP kinase 2, mitochondrial isoform X2 [Phasianus colchicus]
MPFPRVYRRSSERGDRKQIKKPSVSIFFSLSLPPQARPACKERFPAGSAPVIHRTRRGGAENPSPRDTALSFPHRHELVSFLAGSATARPFPRPTPVRQRQRAAMLRGCTAGPPGPLRRALPAAAPAVRLRLRECVVRIPEAGAVLDILEKCPESQRKGEFPVVVFEGLDATGKTTVTQSVKDALGAVLLRSPPACISQWRTIFDEEPTPIRRAFYAAGNYILASEIAKASTQAPVIVDRYWHSTAAYTIATETDGNIQNLPPDHDAVYKWPEDLLKPDLVLLLTVSPEERARRLEGRGLERTKEEAELEANSLFRQRYTLMKELKSRTEGW